MKKIAALTLAVFVALSLAPSPAHADDDGALPDGGSIVTTTDGGPTVTVDLGARQAWVLTLRCEGAQATRYKLCASSTCAVSAHSQLLEYDRTFDLLVNAKPTATPKRYLTISTAYGPGSDAGVPYCLAQTQP